MVAYTLVSSCMRPKRRLPRLAEHPDILTKRCVIRLGVFFTLCVCGSFAGTAQAQDCAQIRQQMISLEASLNQAQGQLAACENRVGICDAGQISGWQETIKLDTEELTVDREDLLKGCAPPPPPPQTLSRSRC
jgi:hypothetical protein